ncbi:hypothetical protein Save01_08490 [Streptomyces avermitilis]|uniref:Uncharacterized protein n=2 Tax=Streptomyces avermitilis TaxID=33903 RepID=Q82RS3_STRAW|nr:hypothetical protein [Streptomyces avermitilis]BAC67779.1 hypothetical protein SAVERM_70 [Streptomyces avermitilis MA-4680 = NBRC 14893]BBJ47451.1 hypothetical protein SAVMC3_00800 [Streptomyces avermitilis]GDY69024.1 hypothetical protein SAV14893_084170 [Streptomyces avermitilis]GDY70594.1 hypothetical protein SAV31267_000790 [Streptomyces avermitilis]
MNRSGSRDAFRSPDAQEVPSGGVDIPVRTETWTSSNTRFGAAPGRTGPHRAGLGPGALRKGRHRGGDPSESVLADLAGVCAERRY